MRSAVLRRAATEGSGSKVWLFVPSGTMPSMRTRSPPMLAAMDVIGETVVATRSPSVEGEGPLVAADEQAESMAAQTATRTRLGREIFMRKA